MKGNLKSQKVRPSYHRTKVVKDNRKKRPGRTIKKKKSNTPDLKQLGDILKTILLDIHLSMPCYGKVDYTRDVQTLERRLDKEGVGFTTKTLPMLFQGILHYLENGVWPQLPFKFRKGQPVFMGRLIGLAVRQGAYSRECMKFLYTFTNAFKKLRGDYKREKLLLQYVEFCKVDDSLPELEINPILETAKAYMSSLISGVTLDHKSCIPRPGPGATNRPYEKHMRYEPHVLFKTVDEVLPYADWFYPTRWDVVHKSRKYLSLEKRDQPASRFKFVPKTYGKARGICIEHNEVQFLQQAISRLLSTVIDKVPTINLRDQSINAKLALENSSTREFATLDMSDASDRIPRSLVSYLFESNSELHDALMALSTRYIVPPEDLLQAYGSVARVVETKKFAPMGSALCFPVMTLVHYVLLKAIVLHSGRGSAVQDSKLIYVYGDDIVAKSCYFELITSTLPRFGMKFNVNKSYANSYFRESCGTHAFRGMDITPVYIKHVPFSKRLDSLLSCLAVEAQFFEKGFAKTAEFFRRAIVKTARDMKLKLLNIVPKGSALLGFRRSGCSMASLITELRFEGYRERNECDILKKGIDYQCKSFRVPLIIKRDEPRTILEHTSALMRWWGERPEKTFDAPEKATDLTIRWSWWIPRLTA